MKLNGKKPQGSYVETVVIPRPPIVVPKVDSQGQPVKDESGQVVMVEEPQAHVFKLQAVLDYEAFDRMVPAPQPPAVIRPGGQNGVNLESAEYKKALEEHNKLRFHWSVLQSLKATDGLEWESVDYERPDTWHLYEQELKDSGFSANEMGLIWLGFRTANAMNEAKMSEARKHFLSREQRG